MKCFRIHLTEVKKLYSEDYKILLKEIKDLSKYKN